MITTNGSLCAPLSFFSGPCVGVEYSLLALPITSDGCFHTKKCEISHFCGQAFWPSKRINFGAWQTMHRKLMYIVVFLRTKNVSIHKDKKNYLVFKNVISQ